MAVLVSDASPLICLAAIRQFNLLRILYGEVLVPAAVSERRVVVHEEGVVESLLMDLAATRPEIDELPE